MSKRKIETLPIKQLKRDELHELLLADARAKEAHLVAENRRLQLRISDLSHELAAKELVTRAQEQQKLRRAEIEEADAALKLAVNAHESLARDVSTRYSMPASRFSFDPLTGVLSEVP